MDLSPKTGHMQTLLRCAASMNLPLYMHPNIKRIFIAALFAFDPIWKQLKCLSVVEGMRKLLYIQVMEC